MKNKIILISSFVLALGLLWYLFIKPYDYRVSFSVKTIPGIINQNIKAWGRTHVKGELISQKGIKNLTQRIRFDSVTHIYEWNIEPVNDSLSKVKVYVKDSANSFYNKITIPFYETLFEKNTKKTLSNYLKKINNHITKFRVRVIGEGNFPSTYCAYIELEGPQSEKASNMMKNQSFLNYLSNGNKKVSPTGNPFIEILDWNIEKNHLQYLFCYPIDIKDTVFLSKEVKHKKFNGKKALKAIYNGNYITSDRAWYTLVNYAKKKNISVDTKPVEYFISNPTLGGNELSWAAEIYLPLSQQDE